MDQNTTVLERAFQLAKSGLCGSINEIRNQLKLEGYSTEYITGKGLTTQLKALIHSAKMAEMMGHIPGPTSDGKMRLRPCELGQQCPALT